MKKIFVLLFILTSFYLYSQNTDYKFKADKHRSTITYYMSHPLHKWSGVSKDVNSVIVSDKSKRQIKKAAVLVKVSSFNSGNANRDSHAMEVLEALKYPYVKFETTSVKDNGKSLDVKGKLTFHGVTRNISFKAEKIRHSNNVIEVKGGFSIDMTQYKIKPPALLGVPTDKEIKIKFDVFY